MKIVRSVKKLAEVRLTIRFCKGTEHADVLSVVVALKLGVGVALVVVAHLVIVRRWRQLTHGRYFDFFPLFVT